MSHDKSYKRFFWLVLFFSLFTFFGGDNEKYELFVQNGYLDAAYYDFYSLEPVYVFLASHSHGLLIVWKFFVYGLATLFTYLGLKRLNVDSFYTLVFFCGFALISYGAARAVLAYSIFLYGLSYLNERKRILKIVGFALLLASYFFHSSMLLPILLMPIAIVIKINRKLLTVMAIMFPVLIGVVSYIPQLFESGLFDFAGQAAWKYQAYVKESEEIGNLTSYGSFLTRIYEILNISLYILSILVTVKFAVTRDVQNASKVIIAISLFLMYIACVFKFSSLPTGGIFYARYFTMAPFFLFAVIPQCVEETPQNAKFLNILVLLCFLRCNFFLFTQLYYASVR